MTTVLVPTTGSGWVRSAEAGLAFRPMVDADLPFLRQVYAATRADEMAVVPWSDADKAAFLDMQFSAQHSHYQQHYPNAAWLVAACDGQDIGRLYLQRCPDRHRIIDIALLPAFRGRGFGTAVLRDLLDEAAGAGKSVEIHVEKFNPARRLYERLGFVMIEDKGIYDLMLWSPPDRAGAAQANTAS